VAEHPRWQSWWKEREARYRRSPFEYREVLTAQRGGCAICRRPPEVSEDTGLPEIFIWDHDHRCCANRKTRLCGKCTRGLLCRRCNYLVGVIERNDLTPHRRYVAKWTKRIWGNGAE
jgi:hypothetical protein